MENFRNEELKRLPRIALNLNKLINEMITLQDNTNLVSEEMIVVRKSLYTIILDEVNDKLFLFSEI
jgi:hypothetical protein